MGFRSSQSRSVAFSRSIISNPEWRKSPDPQTRKPFRGGTQLIKNTLLTLGTCLLVAAASADDASQLSQSRLANWHHWRGPLANGTAPEADPPIKWDEKTNIQWKAPLPGRGSASPIVWGDRVFVLTAVKTDRVATADELPNPDPR